MHSSALGPAPLRPGVGPLDTMKTKRHVLLAAFLLTTAVFVWGCFYIPEAQFRWTVRIGDGEFGLCHIKAMIYFALGDSVAHESRIYVSSAVAAAIVAFAVGLPALALISVITRLWSRTGKHETRTA